MTTLPQLASKRVIYIGGLADEATVDLVRAAMIPFGGIKAIDVVSTADEFVLVQRYHFVLCCCCSRIRVKI